MAWTNNTGGGPWSGGNRPGGPWGQSGGPGLPQGPDLEALLRKAQEGVKRVLPGGMGSGKAMGFIAAGLVGLWLLSGFYNVREGQAGVVLRFGEFVKMTPPGLNYALPAPIDRVILAPVEQRNQIEIGFSSSPTARARGPRGADVIEESLMLTGDENIIDIDFLVVWKINNQQVDHFLFNIRNPEGTVKSAAESAMREVIGRTPLQPALTEARANIEADVLRRTQAILDQYRAGIQIIQIQLQKVDPPAAVIDAFRDVQRANADRERTRNEAESFRNDIIPRARGEAERLVQEAEAFREGQVARATGEAQRFVSVHTAYRQAEDVTKIRMYLETMEDILKSNGMIVVDERLQGVVPFLNLPGAPARTAVPTPGTAGGAAVGAAAIPGIGANPRSGAQR